MAEQKTYDCRYQFLVPVLAVIDGTPPPDDLTPCEQPAMWSTYVQRDRDGQLVDIYTRQCEHHDRLLWDAAGYKRSIRLQAPPPS